MEKQSAKALKKDESQYIRIINTIRDAISILSRQGEILFVNNAFCRLYQYTREEAVGMHALKLIRSDFHDVFQEYTLQLKKTGDFSGETVDIRKDGTTFSTEIRGAEINYNGRQCLLAVIRDVSDRKKYEDALSNLAIEWQSTFDATNNAIWLIDKDYRILRSNKTAEKIFNIPISAMIGKHCWEIVHQTTEPLSDCPLSRARNTSARESTEIQYGDAWLEVTVDPIQEADGQFEKAVHIITDITERKEAERALKESEILYRALFNKNKSVMLLIDPETSCIIDANPSACSYYGYSRDKMQSMKISDINSLSKNELEKEILKANSERRNYFNFRHRLADGTINDVEVYSGPIKVEGRNLLCSIVHDISERKAAEKEQEKLIVQLKNALEEIKTLKGIVPICASCKKIRDDKGYWNHLESYIEKHSDASFSHGMCPECQEKFYGSQKWFKKKK